MGATWRIDTDLNFVHVKFSGRFGTDVLVDTFAAIAADPAWSISLDRIYDLSGIDAFNPANFRPEEIMRAARRSIGEAVMDAGRVAIVATEDIAFAMHRQIAAMRGLSEGRFTVVRTVDAAAEFLGLDPAELR